MTAGSFETLDRHGLVVARLRNDAGLVIELLENGAPFAIRHGQILVNQVLASPLAGGLGNVFLRSLGDDDATFTPLLGPAAPGRFAVGRHEAGWTGSWEGLEFTCTLRLAPDRTDWGWTVRVRNASPKPREIDVVLAQDVGLAAEATVRTNELYTSQYIDHTPLPDEALGDVLCSRQNLAQDGAHPWIAHVCLSGSAGFLTDGFQLFGLDYRATGIPAALARRRLPCERYQYEVALPTLASRPLRLEPGAATKVTFLASFVADHPAATSTDDLRHVRDATAAFADATRKDESPREVARIPSLFDTPRRFVSRDLDAAALEAIAPRPWRHVEERDGRILSFFRDEVEHVVLRAKELVQERPTGHILRSDTTLLPDDEILTATAWMDGVFGSQVAIGNRSFNKLTPVRRNPLGALADGGVRMFVRSTDGWELLGLPSAFAMRPGAARWHYDDGTIALVVVLSASPDDPACVLDVEVTRGGPVELLFVTGVVAGQDEYDTTAHVRVDAERGVLEVAPGPGQRIRDAYPDAAFHVVSPDVDAIDAIGGDGPLYPDGIDRRRPFLVVRTRPVRRFRLAMTGSAVDRARGRELAERYSSGRPTSIGLHAGPAALRATLSGTGVPGGSPTGEDEVARLADVLPWLVHDAVIHLSTPHGLEQYSGAAWGLRDVCQGPVEFLVATGHLDEVRAVLRRVYANQHRATGDWPQWFMVDRYRDVRAADSHADIVHWPLKALCDYVEASGNASILDDRVGYADDDGSESILDHARRQLDLIERECLPGTALVRFGRGDWEDTLQPVDPAMADRLVSSWTVELAFETLERFRLVCERAGQAETATRVRTFCERIRADFNRWLLPDGIVTGLAEFGPSGVSYLLHPRDQRTGVTYRLLPMSRGILSGLFTPAQARRHLAIVREHLAFPDGVRLMDRPMDYHGGVERIFRRAESAANFGREIGLQYVHAHLRYVEALTRLGLADEALEALLAVCPVGLDATVANALPRQANAYFSSSDAAVRDRYEASREFEEVCTGRIGVKGGWRVYSSGPGIFVRLLLASVLGLRAWYDELLFDPVVPARLDGTTLELRHDGRTDRYVWRVAGEAGAPHEVRVNGRVMASRRTDHPYRTGGLLVPRGEVAAALDRATNVIEITA